MRSSFGRTGLRVLAHVGARTERRTRSMVGLSAAPHERSAAPTVLAFDRAGRRPHKPVSPLPHIVLEVMTHDRSNVAGRPPARVKFRLRQRAPRGRGSICSGFAIVGIGSRAKAVRPHCVAFDGIYQRRDTPDRR
jgi:hypothetical protein